jgi:hypothetical protein
MDSTDHTVLEQETSPSGVVVDLSATFHSVQMNDVCPEDDMSVATNLTTNTLLPLTEPPPLQSPEPTPQDLWCDPRLNTRTLASLAQPYQLAWSPPDPAEPELAGIQPAASPDPSPKQHTGDTIVVSRASPNDGAPTPSSDPNDTAPSPSQGHISATPPVPSPNRHTYAKMAATSSGTTPMAPAGRLAQATADVHHTSGIPTPTAAANLIPPPAPDPGPPGTAAPPATNSGTTPVSPAGYLTQATADALLTSGIPTPTAEAAPAPPPATDHVPPGRAALPSYFEEASRLDYALDFTAQPDSDDSATRHSQSSAGSIKRKLPPKSKKPAKKSKPIRSKKATTSSAVAVGRPRWTKSRGTTPPGAGAPP